jgi:hypothetical protein
MTLRLLQQKLRRSSGRAWNLSRRRHVELTSVARPVRVTEGALSRVRLGADPGADLERIV